MTGEEQPTFTNGQEKDELGDVYHDAFTIKKVHDAIERAGIRDILTRNNIVNEMQNAGILFRERGRY